MATTVDVNTSSRATAANNIVSTLGAGSGIDIKALAQQLVEAEQAPREKVINDKIAKSEAKITGYGALKSLLSELRDAFRNIDDANEFRSIAVTNPAPDALGITTDARASAGAFDLEVTQVALPQQHQVAFDDRAQSLNAGSAFTLTYTDVSNGGDAKTISVSRPTPAGIVAAINGSGTGLRAQLIDTGIDNDDGTGTKVYVSVTGPDGVDFTLASSTTDVDFGTATQSAQEAKFSIDGIALARSSNTISDAIDGVTISLKEVTSGAQRVELVRQTGDVVTRLKEFVTAFNAFQDSVKILGQRGSDVETYGGVLAGNALLESVRRMVNRFITADSNTPGTLIRAPRDVGLSLDATGKLVLKEEKLVEQLDARFEEVLTMFTAGRSGKGEYGGADAGMAGEAVRTITQLIKSGGLIDGQNDIAENQKQADEDRLLDLQDRMQRVLERYIRQFSAMEDIVGGSNSTRERLSSTFDAMNARDK